MDLNYASFALLREFVTKKIEEESGRSDTFYGGVKLVMEGAEEDVERGFALMGAKDFPRDKIQNFRKMTKVFRA